MAGKSATLAIRIVSDASGAAKGFNEAASRTEKFRSGVDKAAKGMAVASAALLTLAQDAYQAAAALEQSSGAIESVFGSTSDYISAKAKQAAQDVGLSANSYQELASTMGASLRNMGVSAAQLAPKTDRLIQLGADLAATYGGTTADAVSAIGSLLRGEADPIERFGVGIKAADIAARVAAQGMGDLEGEAAKAATTQAALGLLFEQTGSAAGAFAREAGTAAGQTQRATASWEDAKASLGESLLPIVSAAAMKFSEFSTFLSEHKDAVTILVPLFLAMTAAIWLLNFAMAANPITLIAIGIAAVIAVIAILLVKFKGFRDFMVGVGKAIAYPFQKLWELLQWIGDGIGEFARMTGLNELFGAPAPLAAAPAGLYGAAAAGPAPGLYGASYTGGGGRSSPAAAAAGSVVNITVTGALDPVAVGRQVDRLARKYGQVSGRTTTTGTRR